MKTTIQPIARTIEATKRLCTLPAIPTQDWASGVADALVDLSSSLTVGVLIAHLDPEEQTITPISTGIAQTRSAQHPSAPQTTSQTLYLQDKLERIASLGFKLPENAATRGLVAPFSALHPHWTNTPIGRIFASQHLENPVLAIIPITEKHPGFVLIITLASDQNPAQSGPSSQGLSSQSLESVSSTIETLAGLLPIISNKANLALEQVSNPKAWLTDREHEILDQLILGYSVRVIAANLGRSAHTVHDHVKNLHKKLGASSRGELIAKALGYRPLPKFSPTLQTQLGADPIILAGQSKLAEIKPPRETARPLSRPST